MKKTCDPLEVLVIEPHTAGHHGPYLQWMVETLVEHGHNVTVMTLGESLFHPILKRLISASTHAVKVVAPERSIQHNKSYSGAVGQMVRELSYWKMFRGWYRRTSVKKKPDVVLVPYLDYCLYAIGLLGSPFGNTPWVGVAMRPSFHYRDTGVIAPKPSLAGLKRALFFWLLSNKHLRKLLTIDEPLFEYLNLNAKHCHKVTFLPEPYDVGTVPEPAVAKSKYGFDTQRKLIMVYGAIALRKGAVSLLRAIADQRCPESVDVLFAGKLSEDMHELLGESWVQVLLNTQRLKVIDRFISVEEESDLFSAADIIWLGYLGHYTGSGVLVQAARTGRPIIGCEDGIIGWQAKRYEMGVVVRPNNLASVVSGIRTLIENEGLCIKYASNGKRAFKMHSINLAKDILVNAIDAKISVKAK
jgi:glycosyltransferase involved in cell wall biosynthesis